VPTEHDHRRCRLNLANCLPLIIVFVRRADPCQSSSNIYDGHVFAVEQESIAFDFCARIRKQLGQLSTLNVNIPSRQTLFRLPARSQAYRRTKSFQRNRSMSMMEYQRAVDDRSSHQLTDVNIDNDVTRPTTNSSVNPCSLLPLKIDTTQHDRLHCIDRMSAFAPIDKQQRQFVRTSSSMKNESEEIVDDLMTIVAMEKLNVNNNNVENDSCPMRPIADDTSFNRRRSFHRDKQQVNVVVPLLEHEHILRPSIVVNRYADIGNYVPKLLRDNVTQRSSDSNENIFFRSTHGQLLNGFLQLNVSSGKSLVRHLPTNVTTRQLRTKQR
jgi:hypothetical protein